MNKPDRLISICIPAYKRPENIDRLLHSINIQTFTDFEIIITDDSPDDSLHAVLQKYSQLNITYHKNAKALGTPANWNFAISRASGTWIKLMHDDDWFADERSLEWFAKETQKNVPLIFSAYKNVSDDGSTSDEPMYFPLSWRHRIITNPVLLLARNVIGPPSVTLVHRSISEIYEPKMKWRVDIDFYMRVLKSQRNFAYIDKILVHVGISASQVTKSCIDKPEVELPEGLQLLEKHSVAPLKNIWVYDAWWRIIRNVKVRSFSQLQQFTPSAEWPPVIKNMVQHQARIAPALLRIGVFSKAFMCLSYFANLKFLNGFK